MGAKNRISVLRSSHFAPSYPIRSVTAPILVDLTCSRLIHSGNTFRHPRGLFRWSTSFLKVARLVVVVNGCSLSLTYTTVMEKEGCLASGWLGETVLSPLLCGNPDAPLPRKDGYACLLDPRSPQSSRCSECACA